MELTECKKTTEAVTKTSNNQSLFTSINQRLVLTIKCGYVSGAIDVENRFHNCARK